MITREGQTVTTWANQGEREATVLAIIGEHALIEYEMPKGSTALRVVLCRDPDAVIQRFSYPSTPIRWLKAMRDADTEWWASPQQTGIVPSARELYEKKVNKEKSNA